MKIRVFLFLLSLLSLGLSYGQDQVPSIEKLRAQKNSTKKVEKLNDASEALWNTGEYEQSVLFSKEAIKVARAINDAKGEAVGYNNLGIVCDYQGKNADALDNYFKAVKLQKKVKDQRGLAYTYNNIGLIYSNQKNYSKALEYYHLALSIRKTEKEMYGLSSTYNNIGIIHMFQKKYTEALSDYQASVAIDSSLHDTIGVSTSYSNIGLIYMYQQKYTEALDYYNRALTIRLAMNDQRGIANSYNNIGTLMFESGNTREAKEYFEKALVIGKEIGAKDLIQYSYSELSNVYEKTGDYKNALEYYKNFIVYGDSIMNETNTKKQTETEMQFVFDQKQADERLKQEKRDLLDQQEKKQQLYILIGLFILLVVVLFFTVYLNKSRKTERTQKEQIANQKNLVEEQNREILASISYAKRIQTAILPPVKLVKEYLKNSFVFYQPKDIVAGDFYWMEPLENEIIFAVADCTGHGVPGALVSVVCHNALNRSVREFNLKNPADILDKTRELILHEFEKSDEIVNDGMDISLCKLNFDTGILDYAGANSPIWIIQKQKNELIELKANKQPIGLYANYEPFTTTSIQLHQGDSLYLFTDGFADQFGGKEGKKMKAKRMKELLLAQVNHEMPDQLNALKTFFEEWKGDLEQVDDVCVIGLSY